MSPFADSLYDRTGRRFKRNVEWGALELLNQTILTLVGQACLDYLGVSASS